MTGVTRLALVAGQPIELPLLARGRLEAQRLPRVGAFCLHAVQQAPEGGRRAAVPSFPQFPQDAPPIRRSSWCSRRTRSSKGRLGGLWPTQSAISSGKAVAEGKVPCKTGRNVSAAEQRRIVARPASQRNPWYPPGTARRPEVLRGLEDLQRGQIKATVEKGCQMLPEFSLAGKRFLLTGAGRGIGKGIALVLAEAGADIAVTGLTPNGVTAVADDIRRLGREGRAYVCDATKASEMDDLARRVLDEFGPLDGLVNCVGDAINKPVVQLPGDERPGMTEDEWHSVLDINLTEAFVGCRAFGTSFLERRTGSVVNITAWAAVRPAPRRAAYDAAKAGLVQFTRSLALEWAPFGVRVNAIGPGSFPDPEQMTPQQLERSTEAARRNVPLGRFGRLREVGLLAVYLLSDAGGFVTGQTWFIDGGMSIV